MKTVLLTGATGGLGEAGARTLAGRGWRVFACGTKPEKLQALQGIPGIIPLKMDVTDEQSILSARQSVLQHTGQLDAVVNFAGIGTFASLVEDDAIAVTQRMVDVNILGTVRVNRLFFDLVEKAQGRIVNCSSSVGWMTVQPFSGGYTLTKRAIEGYNDALRREAMFVGVKVIKIQPGPIQTAISDDLLGGFDRTLARTTHYRRVLQRMRPLMQSVMGRQGKPQQVADALVRALEDARPRLYYRVAPGLLLSLMELLPERAVDAAYRWILRGQKN